MIPSTNLIPRSNKDHLQVISVSHYTHVSHLNNNLIVILFRSQISLLFIWHQALIRVLFLFSYIFLMNITHFKSLHIALQYLLCLWCKVLKLSLWRNINTWYHQSCILSKKSLIAPCLNSTLKTIHVPVCNESKKWCKQSKINFMESYCHWRFPLTRNYLFLNF